MKKESDNQVSIETAYKNAADLLQKGEFNLAEQQLSEILKKNKKNAVLKSLDIKLISKDLKESYKII